MEDGFGYILLAGFALFLVIEGAVYALFPETMQRAAAIATQLDPFVLRVVGAVAALIGLLLLAVIRG